MKHDVTILGGGQQGLAMAAYLSDNHIDCYLWNRTHENIQKILETKLVHCAGIMQKEVKICHVSTDIKECIKKTIIVTASSIAHRDIAKMIAPYVNSEHVIVLSPGRTFGAFEFIDELQKNGCKELPMIAEAQTVIFTCRKQGPDKINIFALKKNIPLASVQIEDSSAIIKKLPDCLKKFFVPAASFVETSLGNIGMILHCAPMLFNIGWIESKNSSFKYYYEGISPTVASLLEIMDRERLAIAKAMGYELESVKNWLKRVYKVKGENLFACLQDNVCYRDIHAPDTLKHRYIEEDIPNGLVPLEAVGKEIGVQTPITTLIIDLANAVMATDYRKSGRNGYYLRKWRVAMTQAWEEMR